MAVFDPAELGRLVKISDSVRSLAGGVELTEDQVVSVLLERFGIADISNEDQATYNGAIPATTAYIYGEAQSGGQGAAMRPQTSVLKTILETVAQALPPELRTAEVLSAIDVRPFLSAMKGKTLVANDGAEFTVTPEMVNPHIVQATKVAKDMLLAGSVGSGDYEAREAQADKALTFGTTATALPTVSDTGVQTNDTDFGGYAMGGEAGVDPTISLDELRKAFTVEYGSDILALESLGYEINPQSMLDSGERVAVDLDSFGMPKRTQPYYRPGASIDSGESMNYRAAGEYLFSGRVTPRDITTMQRRLAAAGYFDNQGQPFVPGDGFDDVTNAAWRALLADAFKQNVGIDEILRVKTEARRKALPNLQSNNYRNMMNASAASIIGRSLSEDEQNELISFLQNLQSRQGVPTQTGFAESDVNEYFADEFAPEVERMNLMQGSDTFLKAIGSL